MIDKHCVVQDIDAWLRGKYINEARDRNACINSIECVMLQIIWAADDETHFYERQRFYFKDQLNEFSKSIH